MKIKKQDEKRTWALVSAAHICFDSKNGIGNWVMMTIMMIMMMMMILMIMMIMMLMMLMTIIFIERSFNTLVS